MCPYYAGRALEILVARHRGASLPLVTRGLLKMCVRIDDNQQEIAWDAEMTRLYSYAMALTHNPWEAQDLVQETCVRAISAIGTLRNDSNVSAWLIKILKNIWLNQLRATRSRPRIVELDGDDSAIYVAAETSPDALARYVSKLEQQQLREAIQRLEGKARDIIVMREYEELSYQQIACTLNCPVGTVMSRLARARGKLKAQLSSMPEFRESHTMNTSRQEEYTRT